MEPCKLVQNLEKQVSLRTVDYTLSPTFDSNHFDLHWNVKALDFPLRRFRLMPRTEFVCTGETKRILFETRTFTTNPFYLESVDALRKVLSESNKTSLLCRPVPINRVLRDGILTRTPQIRQLEKQEKIFLRYGHRFDVHEEGKFLTTTFLDDFHDKDILLRGGAVIPSVEHLKEETYLTDFKIFGLPIELKNVHEKRSSMETFVVHPINKTIEHIDSYLHSTNERVPYFTGKNYESIVGRLFHGDAKDKPKFTYKSCFHQIVLDQIPMTLYNFMVKVNPSSYMDHQLWNLFLLSLMLTHVRGEESFSDVLKAYFAGIIQQTSDDGIGMYKTGDMETYRLAIRLERIFLFFVLQLADALKLEGVPVITGAPEVEFT